MAVMCADVLTSMQGVLFSYFSGFFPFGDDAGDIGYQPANSRDESARFFMINPPIIFYNRRQTEIYV
jgi:hypothetical protein